MCKHADSLNQPTRLTSRINFKRQCLGLGGKLEHLTRSHLPADRKSQMEGSLTVASVTEKKKILWLSPSVKIVESYGKLQVPLNRCIAEAVGEMTFSWHVIYCCV